MFDLHTLVDGLVVRVGPGLRLDAGLHQKDRVSHCQTGMISENILGSSLGLITTIRIFTHSQIKYYTASALPTDTVYWSNENILFFPPLKTAMAEQRAATIVLHFRGNY